MMSTTFQKYGGFSAVSRIVMTFYDKDLDNDDVGHHFDDVEMPGLIDHQTKFVSSLMGGPGAISDERLAVVHRQFPTLDAEYDIVSSLLMEAMTEHRVAPDDARSIAKAFEGKRSFIVKRTPA
ncbi:MAG: group 1 truncated hemoglobin [Pseudomonadota bacterium]